MTKVSSVRPRTLWALERITALCLIPLGLWFALHLPRFQSLSREAFVSWCKEPLHLALLAAFLIIASLHARLGLDTIIEDYVSDQRLRRHARWLSGLLLNGSLSMALLALGAMTLGAPS
ncbi:MAG: succinate dehydrogenase, hydrophobic membrane anchor protein [Methylococcus sp.]|jgi:succinate dehydrogenase / fumarate reductase membrane anchor subunit